MSRPGGMHDKFGSHLMRDYFPFLAYTERKDQQLEYDDRARLTKGDREQASESKPSDQLYLYSTYRNRLRIDMSIVLSLMLVTLGYFGRSVPAPWSEKERLNQESDVYSEPVQSRLAYALCTSWKAAHRQQQPICHQ